MVNPGEDEAGAEPPAWLAALLNPLLEGQRPQIADMVGRV